MEAFVVSLSSVATAEMGDRTQLLALVLAARYRKPWPIVAGVLCATLANHAVAGLIGAWFGRQLSPALLDAAVGVSMIWPGTALSRIRIRTITHRCGTVTGTIPTCITATATDGVRSTARRAAQLQCCAARTMKITPTTANSADAV